MSDPEYELIYWPEIPGRGEFIRLAFEDSGTPYLDHAQVNGASSVFSFTSSSNTGTDAGPPPLFVPILRHGDVVINQTANILLYLGQRLGLAPSLVRESGTGSGSAADGAAAYHVNGLVLTALDGLSNETHDTHHPLAVSQVYEAQKAAALERAREYRLNRLPKYLEYFERVLNGPASGEGPWLHGGRCTVADLVLFQCIDGNLYAFPKAMERMQLSNKYERVFRLYEAVKARPLIDAYLKSDRRQTYSQGIYRHYPELDD
jgi:glutathione S-transferase